MRRLICCCLLVVTGGAADWPRFLGKEGNGTSSETGLLKSWPADGPTKLWEHAVGSGYAGPAVATGKVLVFHRVQEDEILGCLDPKTGKPLWKQSSPSDYRDDFGFDDGPRGVPAVAGDHVYTLGAEGRLTCRKLADGA